MNKILSLIMVALLCLGLGYAYANTIGGAETSGAGVAALAFEQEVVFEREMRQNRIKVFDEDGADLGLEMKPNIDIMNTSMVKISYGLLDNLDLYIKLGAGNVRTAGDLSASILGSNGLNGTLKLKGDYGFAYGVGAKGTFDLSSNFFVGCDIQYLRSETHYKGAFDGALAETFGGGHVVGDFGGKLTWQAWQAAPYVAVKLWNFVPYLGVKYSDLIQKYENKNPDDNNGFPIEELTTRSKRNCGLFVGTDYKLGQDWKFNIEGRFIDEVAMSLGAKYSF